MIEQEAPLIWVLADDRAGHANQALGVADALGLPYEVKSLEYWGLAKLPNILLGATFVHLSGDALAPPWPDLVIAAGRRTVPVARAIKRAADARCFLVQCMWPGAGASAIDLIAPPAHDSPRRRANMLRTVAAPHRITSAVLAEARREWQARVGTLPAPRLALLVGGSTAAHDFDAAAARALAGRVAALTQALGGSLMMTTSRRTSPAARDALTATLDPDHRFDDDGDNPYLGYLAWADAIVVTGDSTTMCAEACATGAPVLIDAPDAITGLKHRALHRALYDRGLARPLDEDAAAFVSQHTIPAPLDDAADVAAEIRRRLPTLPEPGSA